MTLNDGWKMVYQIDEMIEDDIEETKERIAHAIGPMEQVDLILLRAYQESLLGRIKLIMRNSLADIAHQMRAGVAVGKDPGQARKDAEKAFRRSEREIYECPHGNPVADCDACDQESDHQYDCDQERRHFGGNK